MGLFPYFTFTSLLHSILKLSSECFLVHVHNIYVRREFNFPRLSLVYSKEEFKDLNLNQHIATLTVYAQHNNIKRPAKNTINIISHSFVCE